MIGENKMEMDNKIEGLSEVYQQCNEHLREGDRKRDQIVFIFASLIGVLIGGIEQIIKLFPMQYKSIISISVFSIAFIGGSILLEVLSSYRMWHLKYTLSCQVIQKLMFNRHEPLSSKKISELLNRSMYKPELRKVLRTTETLMLNIFIILNYISLVIIIFQILGQHIYSAISVIAIGFILYIVIMNYRFYRELKIFYDKVKDKKATIWILDLIDR